MSGFDVEPSELFAAGARVSEAATDGHESVRRVRAEAEGLFDGGWTGGAATAFRAGFDEWLAGTARMLAGLEDLSTALSAAGHDYETAERGNDSMFARSC